MSVDREAREAARRKWTNHLRHLEMYPPSPKIKEYWSEDARMGLAALDHIEAQEKRIQELRGVLEHITDAPPGVESQALRNLAFAALVEEDERG